MKMHHNIRNERIPSEKRQDTTFIRVTRHPRSWGYGSRQEWSMDDYNDDLDETVVEDEEGFKVRLKHTHPPKLSPYDGMLDFW